MKLLYGRSLAETVRSICNVIEKRLWIAVPYVGGVPAVRRVLGNRWLESRNGLDVRLITDIDEDRSSNPYVLDRFAGHGKIRSLRGLHAKLYIADGDAVVTSANLTRRGFWMRHEIGILLTDEKAQDIAKLYEGWWALARDRCIKRKDIALLRQRWNDRSWAEDSDADPGTTGLHDLWGLLDDPGDPDAHPLRLPRCKVIEQAIADRRRQVAAFDEIREQLRELIRNCADGHLSNRQFYEQMMATWRGEARFQGRGFEIRCKKSNWRDVCKALVKILSATAGISLSEMDEMVRAEFDGLANAQNPTRWAWFSEMLCHYFPKLYPLVNKPVTLWLRHNNYRWSSGETEGAAYIALAKHLRATLAQNKKGSSAKDFQELDYAIWMWNSTRRNQTR